jgi:hypothetical protein
MTSEICRQKQDVPVDIAAIADLLLSTQKPSGEIPWSEGDKTDPWDHVEAAMGLSIAGRFQEARRAFEWLAGIQLEDGSWYALYRDGFPLDRTRDANMTSYVAVGVYHHYLVTGDKAFLEAMWPTVSSAVGFALSLQAPGGAIFWAISPQGNIDPMALLTGSSSIYMSLKCALAIAEQIGYIMPEWVEALTNLRTALRYRPHLFNMTKSRYAMDWFYPVLSGALTRSEAQRRIKRYWKKFVVESQGVRCVSDQPWVTLAETSELSLALSAMGNLTLSEIVFNWICDKTFADGSYWCGFTWPDMTTWPEEKITWTNAVVLMAADAIYNLTPASQLFNHMYWSSFNFSFLKDPTVTPSAAIPNSEPSRISI